MRILNWIKRHWILSLFLLIGGVPAGLNYSGFCMEQKRWLSDEEKIRHFVLNNFVSTTDYSGNVFDATGETVIQKKNQSTRYKNFEDFMENNPNCCRFDILESADSGPPTFWTKIKGGYSNTMIINYGKDHKIYDGTTPNKSIAYIDNCGKTVKPW
jgi:hypothetical protein